MTHIITDHSNIQFAAFCSTHLIEPEHVWNLRVLTGNVPLPEGDIYTHGVRFHALLLRIKDHDPLSNLERQYLPFLDALRTELRLHGVSYLYPEQNLSHPKLGRGRCDALLDGGLAPRGVCEVKCVAEVPEKARAVDMIQLGRYLAMLGNTDDQIRLWGCIAYVSIRSRVIRIFAYSDLQTLGRGVANELAA